MTERDRQLLRDIEEMLASPEYSENPLRAPLEALYLRHTDQLERLERMAAISDGFQRGVKSDLTTAERAARAPAAAPAQAVAHRRWLSGAAVRA